MRKKIAALLLMTFFSAFLATAQDVRPIRDSVGFSWNPVQMERLISYLASIEKEPAYSKQIVAGISPHDDYLYAGRMYYPLFRSLHARQIVIFGVTHGTVRKEIGDPRGILLLDDYKEWNGCGKNIGISLLRDYIFSRLDTSMFRLDNKAHRLEHSIEALVPWIQYFNPDATITPIMVTAMSFERMDEISKQLAQIIAAYVAENHLTLGKDIAFLCSSDANHYGKDFSNSPFGMDDAAHAMGTAQDQRIASDFLTGQIDTTKIRLLTSMLKDIVWCGRYSIPFGMLTAHKVATHFAKKSLNGTLLRCSDSYSEGTLPVTKTGMGTTAIFSLEHWVGFFSAAYSLDYVQATQTPAQGSLWETCPEVRDTPQKKEP
jgi:AmmeMemoRadiSam system protein B